MENDTAAVNNSNNNNNNNNNSSNQSFTEVKVHQDITCLVCQDMVTIQRDIFVAQLVFPAVTFIANSITCLAIYRANGLKPSLRLSLLNLSFTDILASLVYIYHIAFSWTSFEINAECIIRYALFVSTVILTQVTIVFMSMDRFLSIFAPFAYEKLSGRYYVIGAIGICWIVMAVYVVVGFSLIRPNAEGCFYPLMMRPEIHLLYGLGSLVLITVVIILNSLIFAFARIQISKIAATLVGADGTKEASRLCLKSAITTVVVVVPFVLTNLPMYILLVYFFVNVDFTLTSDSLYIVNALSSMCLVNSLINPSIYIWRSKKIRKEIKKIGHTILGLCGKGKGSDFDFSKRRSTGLITLRDGANVHCEEDGDKRMRRNRKVT